MAVRKLYDAVVKTGSYTNSNGEEKARYENVGSVFEGDKGPFLVLKRTFNPAGVPFKDGSDSIMVSLFEPKQDDQRQAAPQRQQRAPQRQQAQDFPDEQIPF
jgi:hypothetical protein